MRSLASRGPLAVVSARLAFRSWIAAAAGTLVFAWILSEIPTQQAAHVARATALAWTLEGAPLVTAIVAGPILLSSVTPVLLARRASALRLAAVAAVYSLAAFAPTCVWFAAGLVQHGPEVDLAAAVFAWVEAGAQALVAVSAAVALVAWAGRPALAIGGTVLAQLIVAYLLTSAPQGVVRWLLPVHSMTPTSLAGARAQSVADVVGLAAATFDALALSTLCLLAASAAPSMRRRWSR